MGVESVAIIGRNGMGKSTLCNTIMGLVPTTSGTFALGGRRCPAATRSASPRPASPTCRRAAGCSAAHRRRARRHARQAGPRGKRWTPDAVFELFPRLAQRRRSRAGDLSGGEQQMLAVGRALLLNGSLVMMDEPSEGLAPTIVDTLIESVRHLVAEGVAVLVVEQNLYAATHMAERVLVMVAGRIEAETTATAPCSTTRPATPLPRRRHDRGRVDEARTMTDHDQRRPDRLEVHGPRPLQRLGHRGPLLRRRPAAGDAPRVRPQRRRARRVRRPLGLGRRRRPTGALRRRRTTSSSSTSPRRTTSTPSRRSPPSRPASTSPARSRWPARSPTPRRWRRPPPSASGSTFVWFNYRRVPAVALAHQLVAEGALGRIYHVRAAYLQSWGGPDTPLLWRFQGDVAGSGAHGDLNAHIVDMVRFVTGEEIVTDRRRHRAHLRHRAGRPRRRRRRRDRRRRSGEGRRHGAEHRRRRRAVPRPHERRRPGQLRGVAAGHRLPQRQPLRDPRRARRAALRLRADERARALRRHRPTAACRAGPRSTSPAAATATRTPRPGGPTATASATSTASSTRRPTSSPSSAAAARSCRCPTSPTPS